jgi:hypothetical protein
MEKKKEKEGTGSSWKRRGIAVDDKREEDAGDGHRLRHGKG